MLHYLRPRRQIRGLQCAQCRDRFIINTYRHISISSACLRPDRLYWWWSGCPLLSPPERNRKHACNMRLGGGGGLCRFVCYVWRCFADDRLDPDYYCPVEVRRQYVRAHILTIDILSILACSVLYCVQRKSLLMCVPKRFEKFDLWYTSGWYLILIAASFKTVHSHHITSLSIFKFC